ncbi:hypothetical protein D0T12_04865 [Actinomadura spongiicola]|uniref:Uncharacterized protein n=1 Tax=Actinomadura spongiicola TaxID=2303421 RepID=A0A372GKS6_9ACTN|nr:hypothetical protein [Actinomadura spongiicola]RFS85974.1 hypothetical protein D0T12_04865 [Actinomadura spongiicola]
MTKQTLTCPNLSKLFGRIEGYAGEENVVYPPPPEPRSSLAADANTLQGKWFTTPIYTSFGAGVEQVYVLRRNITELEWLGTVYPYALLRSALENFAHVAWLLNGKTRDERRTRALQTWAYDFEQRGKYEDEIGHAPEPPAKRGSERRGEILQLAKDLGLPDNRVGAKLNMVDMIKRAAEDAGFTPSEPVAAWRMASGFVHGRVWPNLRASEPTGAVAIDGGAWIRFVISDEKLDEIALWCDRFLAHSLDVYRKRRQAPDY